MPRRTCCAPSTVWSKFLLRRAIHPPVGVRAWSRAHDAWLAGLTFEHAADAVVLEHYHAVVHEAAERVRRLEAALVACAAESPHAQVLAALQAIRGIGFLSAVTIVAEAGDLRRFPTARAFMAYVGLVPSEYSSGTSRHRGRITKTGNRLIRHVLGQAAYNARYRPNVSSALRARQSLVPPVVVDLDRRAQARLHARYRHLAGRIGVNKAVTAIARGLAGRTIARLRSLRLERDRALASSRGHRQASHSAADDDPPGPGCESQALPDVSREVTC